MSPGFAMTGGDSARDRSAAPPERLLDSRLRARRALLACLAWTLAIAPALLGWQQCGFAKMFHRPCPGCGMTRAVMLLLDGDWRASLRMHPLAVPVLVAGAAFAASTIWTTYSRGAPLIHQTRFGRTAIAALAIVYAATIALWLLRWTGAFGGPVSVY